MKLQDLAAKWKRCRAEIKSGGCAAAGVLILFLGAVPFWQRGLAARQELARLEARRDEVLRFAGHYDAGRERHLRLRLQDLEAAFPAAGDAHGQAAALTRKAEQNGLILAAFRPVRGTAQAKPSSRQVYELELRGDYFRLLCFLQALEEGRGPYVLQVGLLQREKEGQGLVFRCRVAVITREGSSEKKT